MQSGLTRIWTWVSVSISYNNNYYYSTSISFDAYIYIYIYIVLLWTPTYGRAKAGRPARTYIQLLCEDTGCSSEDLPEVMNDREKWRERVRDICASGMTWWWWCIYIYIYIYIYMHTHIYIYINFFLALA